jgi:hypothetical protein
MAEITLDRSWREIRTLNDRAEQAAEQRRWTEAVERCCGHVQAAADDAP